MSVIFAITKIYVLYLRCQDMLLFYHQLDVCYLFHQDYALQSIACNSVKFMIIASNAYLVIYYGFICYIVNAFIKIIKCQLFRCRLVLYLNKFRVFYFKIIFLHFVTISFWCICCKFCNFLPPLSSFIKPITFLFLLQVMIFSFSSFIILQCFKPFSSIISNIFIKTFVFINRMRLSDQRLRFHHTIFIKLIY